MEEVQGGVPIILKVVGDVPGLQNAGVMWAEEFTRFLTKFGFAQSIVGRRLFFMYNEEGQALLLESPVDDYKLVVQFWGVGREV